MQAFTDFALDADAARRTPIGAPRQLAQHRSAGRPRLLLRQPARRRHLVRQRPRLQLQRLPRDRPEPGLLRHQRRRELRERAADRQGRAPPEPLPKGRHVRHAGDLVPERAATTAARAIRSAASASSTTAASTRSSASCRRPSSTTPTACGFNGGDAQRRQMEQFLLRVRQRPGAGRRPAGDADVDEQCGWPGRASISWCSAPGRRSSPKVLGGMVTECDLVVKGTVARTGARLAAERRRASS